MQTKKSSINLKYRCYLKIIISILSLQFVIFGPVYGLNTIPDEVEVIIEKFLEMQTLRYWQTNPGKLILTMTGAGGGMMATSAGIRLIPAVSKVIQAENFLDSTRMGMLADDYSAFNRFLRADRLDAIDNLRRSSCMAKFGAKASKVLKFLGGGAIGSAVIGALIEMFFFPTRLTEEGDEFRPNYLSREGIERFGKLDRERQLREIKNNPELAEHIQLRHQETLQNLACLNDQLLPLIMKQECDNNGNIKSVSLKDGSDGTIEYRISDKSPHLTSIREDKEGQVSKTFYYLKSNGDLNSVYMVDSKGGYRTFSSSSSLKKDSVESERYDQANSIIMLTNRVCKKESNNKTNNSNSDKKIGVI